MCHKWQDVYVVFYDIVGTGTTIITGALLNWSTTTAFQISDALIILSF